MEIISCRLPPKYGERTGAEAPLSLILSQNLRLVGQRTPSKTTPGDLGLPPLPPLSLVITGRIREKMKMTTTAITTTTTNPSRPLLRQNDCPGRPEAEDAESVKFDLLLRGLKSLIRQMYINIIV